jgi:hypothetical protein
MMSCFFLPQDQSIPPETAPETQGRRPGHVQHSRGWKSVVTSILARAIKWLLREHTGRGHAKRRAVSERTSVVMSATVLLSAGGLACSQAPADEVPADLDAVEARADVPAGCPEGLRGWEEYGVCAPPVPACERPWEIPVVGAAAARAGAPGDGCLPVGPRACPKLWDPISEVQCQPGGLVDFDGAACRPGFVLTDDEAACIPLFEEGCGEVEIPVLGGGCKKIGPQWAKAGQPLFDDCEPGHLALPGGGCAPVGPRACPKLWDPLAAADCQAGDLLPCPAGWAESEDGLSCDPGYAECPAGELALPGGSCEWVVAKPEECPAGPFPEAPPGATEVLHVLAASQCQSGCGGKEKPYPSVQAAVDAAPDGAAVLVGPGTYDEGILLTRAVSVIGLCASLVTISGTAPMPGDSAKVKLAGIAVSKAGGLEISGVRVASAAVGLALDGAKDVIVEGIEVAGARGLGLYVAGGSDLHAERLSIHDTTPETESTWMKGYGLWVAGGSQAEIEQSLMEKAQGAGAYVRDPGTSLTMSGSTVRSTLPLANGELGYGLAVTDGAEGQVVDCLLEANGEAGIRLVHPGTHLGMATTVVRYSKPTPEGLYGHGLVAVKGASATLTDCLFDGNASEGIWAGYAGTALELVGTVVRGTVPDGEGSYGSGIQVILAASAVISRCLVEGNWAGGLSTAYPGTQLELTGTLVRRNKANSTGQSGIGLQAFEGAQVALSSCLFEENDSEGLLISGAEAFVELSKCVVRDTMFDAGGSFGQAMQVADGARVGASDSLFDSNASEAISAFDPGTLVELLDSVVRDTKPDGEGDLGHGLQASEGAAISLSASVLEDNSETAVLAAGVGTEVTLTDTIVRDTRWNAESGLGGRALQVTKGSRAVLTDCLLERNAERGILAAGTGTELTLAGCAVLDTQPDGTGDGGWGIQAGAGASVSISSSLISDNTEGGILVADPGSELKLDAAVVRRSMPSVQGKFGRGLEVQNRAAVTVVDSLFDDNAELGIRATEAGTRVELSGSVLHNTTANVGGKFRRGLEVSAGAQAFVSRGLFDATPVVALLAVHPGTKVEMAGSMLRTTRLDEQEQFGMAAAAFLGAELLVIDSLFQENHTAALMAGDPGTVVAISGSAALGTRGGGVAGRGLQQEYGDGFVAVAGARLDVESAVVAGNSRVGLYYREAEGKVTGSVIWNNGSYGLAMHECVAQVDYGSTTGYSLGDGGNFVFGNAAGLPPAYALDVTTSPGALPLPNPPQVEEMPR